jgi:hypothetical protein
VSVGNERVSMERAGQPRHRWANPRGRESGREGVNWASAALDVFDNGVNGMSDIEGKAAREAVSECGQRASFNGDRENGRHRRKPEG